MASASPASEGMGDALAARLRAAGLEVELVPCLQDNYSPILHSPTDGTTMIVDAPEAGPILAALKRRNWVPTDLLCTHHHCDHVGGNLEIKKAFPDVRIIGQKDQEGERIPGVTAPVADGDVVKVGGLEVRAMAVGGHTLGHLAYFIPEVPVVFTGDCLFNMGCGRVFTGDFARMQASLSRLRDLPPHTVVYSGHEYTEQNVAFAAKVEPQNGQIEERAAVVRALRSRGLPTVPSLLEHDRATNVFLRWDAPDVVAAAKTSGGGSDSVSVFTFVRKWKDSGSKPSGLCPCV